MIVVVGNPAWRAVAPAAPVGRACDIALAAAAREASVELVGRIGDDAAGDALLLALSRVGVGHVAMLRDPARPTPILDPGARAAEEDADGSIDAALAAADGSGPQAGDGPLGTPSLVDGPRLEAADVALGLRYLDGFRVLVVADGVPDEVLPIAIEAGGFEGAYLIVLVAPGAAEPGDLPAGSTALQVPDADDGAFAGLVAAYAAALDRGATPAAAFAEATGDAGWEALAAQR